MKKLLTLIIIGLFAFVVSCSNSTTTTTSNTLTTTESMSSQISNLSNPYNIALFVTADMSTSIGINFELPQSVNGYVEYREAGETEYLSIKAAKKIRNFLEVEVYLYEATLIGLTADTTYEYRIVCEGYDIISDAYSFKTLSDSQDAYSFMFLADPQENAETGYMAYAYSIMSVMEHSQQDIQMVMFPGDVVNDHNIRSQWNLFFRYSSIFSYEIPIATTLGNHEIPGFDDEDINLLEFDGYMNLPNNGPIYGNFNSLSGDARDHIFDNRKTYSFDYGFAHIVVVDSEMYCDGTLACTSYDIDNVTLLNNWIREDLNESDAIWKIVMLHRGPYGLTYNTENVRESLVPVLEECGVDLVLAGHEHKYSRSVYWQGERVDFSQSANYSFGDITLTTGLSTSWHFNNYSSDLGVTYLTSNTSGTKFYDSSISSGIAMNFGYIGEYPIIPIITITENKIEVISYAVMKESGLSIIPTGVFILEQFQIIK